MNPYVHYRETNMRISSLYLLFLLIIPYTSNAVSCNISNVSPVNFGTVNPLSQTDTRTSMTFRYTCSKALTDVLAGVTLCFNLGPSAVSGNINYRQLALTTQPASNIMYQLYQDPAYANVWGSQFQSGTTYPMVKIPLPDLLPVSGSLTVYGLLSGSLTAALPGNYQDNYTPSTANVTLNIGLLSPPSACGTTSGPSFPFNVTAFITKQCNINFVNDVNLGSVNAGQQNIVSSSTLSVSCSANTSYTIGLTPSNGNAFGRGTMKTSNTNTDLVMYQLQSTSGTNGTPWGNSPQTTVAGTGSGQPTIFNVYAIVPQTAVSPDNYSDTVTITIIY